MHVHASGDIFKISHVSWMGRKTGGELVSHSQRIGHSTEAAELNVELNYDPGVVTCPIPLCV